nr:IucA/IucC family siderophore biosynthesis protein [Bacteriovorax sp. HI3]
MWLSIMQVNALSEKHSAHCFLNSLFREWSDYNFDQDSNSFVIPLKNEGAVILPLVTFSEIGRHEYSDSFFYKKDKRADVEEVSFLELVEVLLVHLSAQYKTSPEQISIFMERITDSVNNIESALAIRLNELLKLYSKGEMNFKEAEQGLFIGHTFHPHPKNRDGFSREDFREFAPESAGEFLLHWFLVKPEILHHHVSKNFETKNWSKDMILVAFSENAFLEKKLAEGYIPYPVHPWQKKIILKNPLIREYVEGDLLIDLGASENQMEKWSPTSSLRSLYNEHSPYMLKFSLSVRLTNSVRHLLPLEVVRGLQVMDVFKTEKGKEFFHKYPNFTILFEPAFMALVDKDQKILNETIVALRLNPFTVGESDQKCVLATLTQDHPTGGKSLIGLHLSQLVRESGKTSDELAVLWLKKYLDVAVKPLMMAQANYGVLLGAHQQNMILDIENHLPKKAYFRDCQGTGYSKVGFELFAKDVDLMTVENGNILDDKMGNTLFSYYLMINSTFNVISTLARNGKVAEKDLLKVLRQSLLDWKSEGVRDTSCFNYLLDEEFLLQKGNFLCSFVNMNENTTENPLGIYNQIKNPLCEKNLC